MGDVGDRNDQKRHQHLKNSHQDISSPISVTNIDVAHEFSELSLAGEPYLYLPNRRTFLGSSSVGVFDFVLEDFAALLPLPLSLPFPLLFALSGFSCFSSAINSFSFSLRSTLSSSARFGSSFMGFQTGAYAFDRRRALERHRVRKAM